MQFIQFPFQFTLTISTRLLHWVFHSYRCPSPSPSVPSLPLFFGVGQSCDLPRHPFLCRSCMWRPRSARRRCANCPRSSSSTAAETATTNCTPRPLAGIRLQAGNLPPHLLLLVTLLGLVNVLAVGSWLWCLVGVAVDASIAKRSQNWFHFWCKRKLNKVSVAVSVSIALRSCVSVSVSVVVVVVSVLRRITWLTLALMRHVAAAAAAAGE